MDYLLQNCKIVPAVVPTVGSAGLQTRTIVDGRGFSRALFILITGAATSGGTATTKIIKSAAANLGSPADCTGAVLANLADTDGSKCFGIDVTIDPAKPYMGVTFTTVTQAIVNGWICILYDGSGSYPKAAPASEAVLA